MEGDGPDSAIRIAMTRGIPGEPGFIRMLHCSDSPFAVVRTAGPSPEIFLTVRAATGSGDGSSICITEAVARQLVEDLARALDATEGYVSRYPEPDDA